LEYIESASGDFQKKRLPGIQAAFQGKKVYIELLLKDTPDMHLRQCRRTENGLFCVRQKKDEAHKIS
jgi:hypothetical protein